jgi:hypothetical protein
LFHRVIQISGDPAFDHHALCFEVQLVGFDLDQVVLGLAPRRATRRFAILISRPVFLDWLPLVSRVHGTNAAHCTTVPSKR